MIHKKVVYATINAKYKFTLCIEYRSPSKRTNKYLWAGSPANYSHEYKYSPSRRDSPTESGHIPPGHGSSSTG